MCFLGSEAAQKYTKVLLFRVTWPLGNEGQVTL